MYRSVTLSVSIVVSLMAAVVAQSLHAAPLTIVEDGRARAVIVVEAGEPKAMKAGQALQTYVEKMSGAKLALIEEGQAVPGDMPVRLLVGHTQAARELGVEIPSGYDTTIRPDIFEEEGYALKTVGRDLVIGGNNDGYYKGTLYAAYALLERLGCRWYFPDEWGEVVPEQKTITVPELDVVSRPDFPVRNVNPSGWVPMPGNERELAWLLSFYWNVDQAYNTLPELSGRLGEGSRPSGATLSALGAKYRASGVQISSEGAAELGKVGLGK